MDCVTRFWKWWWTPWGWNSTLISRRFSPPPLSAITLPFSTGFNKSFTWFNWVIFHGYGLIEDLAKQLLSLTAHPSNTNNQQLITRLYPERTAHYTRLAAASLLLPTLTSIWKPQFYQFGHVYIDCDAWVSHLIQLSTCRMEQDSSSLTKFASKFKSLQLRRKIYNDKMW